MSGRKLLIYLSALLLVAGAYFFSESSHKWQESRDKEAKQVFQVKPDDMQTLTLKNDKGEIALKRVSKTEEPSPAETPAPVSANQWRLVKPIDSKVDELTLNSLLTALADLKMQRQLESVPPDRNKEFGLDKPILTVEFQAADKSHEIRFGHKTPGDQSIYAQKDDDPRILLIRLADKETLNRSLTDLRSKKIFFLNPCQVTELRLIRNDGRLILRKADSSSWIPEITPPIKIRPDKLNSLLGQISGARALEFVAEKADDLKKYGLAPSPSLRLTLLSGSQEETLIIGSKQGDRYYAQVSGSAPVFQVDQALVEKLPASYEALEDRRLWAGADTEVQKIIWGAPDKLQTAVRNKDGWNLLNGDNKPIRQEPAMKLNLVFWRVKDLEFTRVLPAAQVKKEKGPLFTLQLIGSEDKNVFKLEEFSVDKDQVQVLTTEGDKTSAALVPVRQLNQLQETLAGLAAPEPEKTQQQTPEK